MSFKTHSQLMFTSNSRTKATKPAKLCDYKINIVYLKAELGKTLFIACNKYASGKINEVCIFTELSIRVLFAMKTGDIRGFSIEDVQQACIALHWTFIYSADKNGFSGRIKTPDELYSCSGHWRDDDEEIKTILKNRKNGNNQFTKLKK